MLDPKRKGNHYGGNVLDTMVEKLDADAGSDCAVILAGYRQEMFDMLENNPGLRRRFNIDDFGIEFEDMQDEELKAVLISGVAKAGLAFENLDDIEAVVSFIAQKRRMPGFGNAGNCLPSQHVPLLQFIPYRIAHLLHKQQSRVEIFEETWCAGVVRRR